MKPVDLDALEQSSHGIIFRDVIAELRAARAIVEAAKDYTFWIEARDQRLNEPYSHEEMIEEACRYCQEAETKYRAAVTALETLNA